MIHALLDARDRAGQDMRDARQGQADKLRKITQERDTLERKCQRLEQQVGNMDKQKY